MALVYNKALAEDALTDADIPKTLQDMYDICDKVVSYNRANNTDCRSLKANHDSRK